MVASSALGSECLSAACFCSISELRYVFASARDERVRVGVDESGLSDLLCARLAWAKTRILPLMSV